MAEERRGYYNEVLNVAANSESFGTPLTNISDEELHIRQVDITVVAEDIAVNEGAMVEATKRASRAQVVGHQPISMRVAATSNGGAADDQSENSKTWVYPRGGLVLETGDTLHNHFTELKDGGTYDAFVDIQYHY